MNINYKSCNYYPGGESNYKALDTDKYVVGVFLDLINHGILVRKLKSYGIQLNILNWLKSH